MISTLERLVRDCETSGVARQVLLLRPEAPATDAWVDAEPRDALDCLTRHARAQRHQLSSERWAVSWAGENPALTPTLAALAQLAPGYRACVFHLPRDGDNLLGELDEAIAAPAPARGRRLDEAALASLERGLANADVSRFARRTRVMRRTEDGMRLAWEKRHLCLSDIARTLAPGYDLLADRLRLRRLCRTLDNRMLRLLTDAAELDGAAPFALNLNIGSVAGAEFARFDAALPAALRGHVTIMLSLDDVLADPAGFNDVRDELRARRHSVLLRGLRAELAVAVALDRLAPDFVQFAWSPSLAHQRFAVGQTQAVLSGVDGAAALRWAARAGVQLFQAAP